MTIVQFPQLYARTSTGAVQIWWMQQEGDKYRSISGQIDGLKVTSNWTVAEPKNVGKVNETTAENQAALEIQAKYDKQLKSGGYFQKIEDIDNFRFFEVMLAKEFKTYKDKIDWSKRVGVQVKYNGGRVIATRHGLFSRKGERYVSIPHIEEGLRPFFKKFPDAVLDGEGFNYDLREHLNEIMKLLRKTVHITPADLRRSKELIRFYIYDGFGFGAKQNDGYEERKKAIDKAFHSKDFHWRYKDLIGYVPTWFARSQNELDLIYQSFLKQKHEGAIIRILGKPYENKRSKYLLKYKPVDDAEFKIIAINEGSGNWAGMAATVTCQMDDGRTFDATVKGTEAEKAKLLKEADKVIGEVGTIYYFGLTGLGKPNYAQFDVNNWRKS
jgi:DNA ligase-1